MLEWAVMQSIKTCRCESIRSCRTAASSASSGGRSTKRDRCWMRVRGSSSGLSVEVRVWRAVHRAIDGRPRHCRGGRGRTGPGGRCRRGAIARGRAPGWRCPAGGRWPRCSGTWPRRRGRRATGLAVGSPSEARTSVAKSTRTRTATDTHHRSCHSSVARRGFTDRHAGLAGRGLSRARSEGVEAGFAMQLGSASGGLNTARARLTESGPRSRVRRVRTGGRPRGHAA